MTAVHTSLADSAASELRQALRGPDWSDRPQDTIDFMLSSARAATLRFNTGGWVVRGVCLMSVAIPLGMMHLPQVWWCLVSFTGWVLAGVELFGSELLDTTSRLPGPIGRMASRSAKSRIIALPTLPGVLENAGSALLLWAASASGDGLLHDVPVVGTLAYVAVAASQVVMAVGYYNREPGQESARWIMVFRWCMAPLYAVVALVALAWLNPTLSGWLIAVIVTVFAGVIVIGAISDSHQTAATTAHLVASEQQARALVGLLSEEVHRVSTSLSEMAHSARDTAIAKALQVGFAEVDAIRFQASRGDLGRTLSLGDMLTLLDRKSGSDRAAVTTNASELVLSDGGNTILRHLIIDLVTNARAAGGTAVQANVDVRCVVGPFVYLHVTVSNESTVPPDQDDLNEFVAGSSRAALMGILSRKRGSLRYEVSGHRTVAHAEYRTELGVPIPKGDG